jgi:hypothetical protein
MSFIIDPYTHGDGLIGPNTGLNLATHKLKSMMVEHSIGLTEVASDGDAVGLMYDQTVNGMILRQDTAANRPILGSDGTRNSYLTFDGTNDNLPILSSLSFFNALHDVVPRGTILIWFKVNGGDGTDMMITTNTNLTTDPGFSILRTSTNVLRVRAGDGTIRWTYTTAATVVAADGWRGLIVSINGTGASAGRFILMNSAGTILEDQTFAVAAGAIINAVGITYIGARDAAGTLGLFFNGSISALIAVNFPVSDKLIDEFRNYNPVKDTTDFAPITQWTIDINNGIYLFNDALGTVQASANDPIRIIRNSIIGNFTTTFAFGALRRLMLSSSSGVSPILRANILNGFPALEFDGTDDDIDFLHGFFDENGGKWTAFFVTENQDAALGSHLMRGNGYLRQTAAAFGTARVQLFVDGLATNLTITLKNSGSNGPKVFAIRRSGSAFAGWNGDKTKTTQTSSARFSIDDMGLRHASAGAGWEFDGYMFYFSKYIGVMSDAQVESEIDRLNAKFAL